MLKVDYDNVKDEYNVRIGEHRHKVSFTDDASNALSTIPRRDSITITVVANLEGTLLTPIEVGGLVIAQLGMYNTDIGKVWVVPMATNPFEMLGFDKPTAAALLAALDVKKARPVALTITPRE